MSREMRDMPKFSIINAREPIIEQNGSPTPVFYGFCRSVWNALNGNSSISAPTGGSTVDTEARQAIQQILDVLNQSGITKG